jgi:hypothetical protein
MALTNIKVCSAKPQEKEYNTLVDGDACFCLFTLTAQNIGGSAFASEASST